MTMELSFDLTDQVFFLRSGTRIWDAAEVPTDPGVAVYFPDEDSNTPVGLEVLGFRGILPLGKEGYSAESDTQSLGDKGGATLVVENGDLVAYFGLYDATYPEDLYLLAVDLRNASKHLAPLIGAFLDS